MHAWKSSACSVARALTFCLIGRRRRSSVAMSAEATGAGSITGGRPTPAGLAASAQRSAKGAASRWNGAGNRSPPFGSASFAPRRVRTSTASGTQVNNTQIGLAETGSDPTNKRLGRLRSLAGTRRRAGPAVRLAWSFMLTTSNRTRITRNFAGRSAMGSRSALAVIGRYTLRQMQMR